MATREASHAGSWYTARGSTLSRELDGWLSQVPSSIEDSSVPIAGARIIIAPHAGYAYSGPAAAWAYATLDLSQTKRIFLLGPSHGGRYLSGCALTTYTYYDTPLGKLTIDTAMNAKLIKEGPFETFETDMDLAEHSLEMHLPYIYKMIARARPDADPSSYPTLVPVLVGNTKPETERRFGAIFAPYLADPTNAFVVSSDFCHWGLRFQYTYYLPSSQQKTKNNQTDGSDGIMLKRHHDDPTDPLIHESIARLDQLTMDTVASGEHQAFLSNLWETGNTVCGRHPIGVMMAAMEHLSATTSGSGSDSEPNGNSGTNKSPKGKFKFVRYERSSDVLEISDSSVSYASAYAIV